jgi:DNA-binding SARP family transcriptional activator
MRSSAEALNMDQFMAEIVDLRQKVVSLSARLPGSDGLAMPPAASDLYARCFGSFTLLRLGQPLELGNSRPVAELCRYLVAHAGHLVPCEQLLDLLWPDAPPLQALHRLHVAASALRRIVDVAAAPTSLIQFHDDSYTIPAGAIVSDFALFEAYYKEAKAGQASHNLDGAAQSFRAALDLYTSDFLSDRLYVDWTIKRRVYFSERRLAAMTFLCEYAVLAHDLGSVVEYAQQILEIDNLRERAHRDLMRAHYYLGQRAIALRQYRTCAAILRDELDVEPSLLTTQVYESIQDNRELPLEAAVLH